MATFQERLNALLTEELSSLYGPVNGEQGVALSVAERERLAEIVAQGKEAEARIKVIRKEFAEIATYKDDLRDTLTLLRSGEVQALEEVLASVRGDLRELLVEVCVRSHAVDPVATELDIARRIPTFVVDNARVNGPQLSLR
jgi:hypothetical protein